MEQIPLWFNSQASQGYRGGTSIKNRVKTEDLIESVLDAGAYASIFFHVYHHWPAMFHIGQTVKPGQKGYEDRFSYAVWWELADTILQSVQFLDPAYEKTVKTIDKLKVKCQQIKCANIEIGRRALVEN